MKSAVLSTLRHAAVSGLALVALWPQGARASGANDLVSHQAVYRMALADAQPGSGVVGAAGALLFRFVDQCDGWTSEISSDLRIDYGEEGEVRSRWSFATWESKDGLNFRFRSHEWEDDEETPLSIEGTATLTSRGGAGRAVYVRPEALEIDLPPGTVFPTGHLLALLEAARRGTAFLSVPLFDGTSLDNPYTVSAVIAPLDAEQRQAAAQATGLPDMPAWRFSLAFFAPTTVDGAPDFGLTVRYRADGVSDRLVQGYGAFDMSVSVEQFDVLPGTPCGR